MMRFLARTPEEDQSAVAVLAPVFGNFAQASGKRKLPGLQRLFSVLAASFAIKAANRKRLDQSKHPSEDPQERARTLQELVTGLYAEGLKTARAEADRAVLRALTWGKKVTAIHNTMIKRLAAAGSAASAVVKEEQRVYVCQACGFIMIAGNPPPVCPVCKAPAKRFGAISPAISPERGKGTR